MIVLWYLYSKLIMLQSILYPIICSIFKFIVPLKCQWAFISDKVCNGTIHWLLISATIPRGLCWCCSWWGRQAWWPPSCPARSAPSPPPPPPWCWWWCSSPPPTSSRCHRRQPSQCHRRPNPRRQSRCAKTGIVKHRVKNGFSRIQREYDRVKEKWNSSERGAWEVKEVERNS